MLTMQGLPLGGVIGYQAHVHKLGDTLALVQQRLRDLQAQKKNGVTITTSGQNIDHCIAVVTAKVEAAQVAYDRAVAELIPAVPSAPAARAESPRPAPIVWPDEEEMPDPFEGM